ncbi:MAG: hypothetical protein LBB60_01175 [Desulfovibrio sp.]|jgi:hypothetical protein|nr:hypothetical protein [Desulfovibrio sp.]
MIESELARIEDEYVAAGYDREAAAAYRVLMEAHAAAFERLYGFDAASTLRAVNIERADAGEDAGALWQVDKDGNAVAPGERNPKIATVVEIDPAKIPVSLKNTRELSKWLLSQYQGVTLTIADDGTIQTFTKEGLEASTKKRGETQRKFYADLDKLLEYAIFAGFIESDSRHPQLVGQNVYYSAAKIGDQFYSIRLKVDIHKNKSDPAYKDHKFSEIEIAPSLYRGQPNVTTQTKDAIRGISLSVLKREVKPSRIENGVLYQFAGENSRMSEPVRANLAEAVALAESGTDNEAIRQKTGWFKSMDGKWRYEIPDKMYEIDFGEFDKQGTNKLLLGQIYGNDELFRAYPELNWINVQLYTPVKPGEGGHYDSSGNLIAISRDVSDGMKRRFLLHEIQHAIQRKEGFARGGNPRQFITKTIDTEEMESIKRESDELRERHPGISGLGNRYLEFVDALSENNVDEAAIGNELERLEAEGKDRFGEDFTRLLSLSVELQLARSRAPRLTAQQQYENLAGEIEANDTMGRSNLSDSERAAKAPDLRSDAIVLFGGEQVAAMSIDDAIAPEQLRKAAQMPRSAESTHRAAEVVRKAGVVNKKLTNKKFRLTGVVSGQSLQKMVSGKAAQKSVSPGAHAHAIANIDALFERAALHNRHGDIEKNPDIAQIHQLGALMEYSGEFYPVKITIKEYTSQEQENKVYSVEAVDVENVKKEAPGTMKEGADSTLPPPLKSSSFNKRLARLLERVKPDLSLNSPAPRGSVTFGHDGQSLTRIFASADLSTPIHEGAHVFINDLTRVVEDNGLRARLAYEREIAAIPADIASTVALEGRTGEDALAVAEKRRTDKDSRDSRDDDRERERRRGDIEARYRKHMRGLERAKADMRALRENADAQRAAHGKAIGREFEEVPLEGPLTPGQYRTLQEVNAAAFEHYLLTDNAPPPKVEGIFSRMKAWLAGVYEAAKTAAASAVAGVCVTPEAREVFDRLLSAPDGDEDEESAACPAP